MPETFDNWRDLVASCIYSRVGVCVCVCGVCVCVCVCVWGGGHSFIEGGR